MLKNISYNFDWGLAYVRQVISKARSRNYANG